MVRFIHSADLHLGRSLKASSNMTDPFIYMASQATYHSFEKLVTVAISKKVDFFLVSGDIYDEEQRSIKGQWFFRKQALRLQKESIPLYIIHGNHDPLVYKDNLISMPENVHIFSSKVSSMFLKTEAKEEVYIYGFSYPQVAYMENPVPLYQKERNNEAYHIGMLHGQESGQLGHDPYAPFTVSSLLEKEFDYWALGHVHKREVLTDNPPVVYPGNVQGCHRKESGPKGAYLVEITKKETSLSFIETAPIAWMEIRVSINGLLTVDELIDEVGERIQALEDTRAYILSLVIDGKGKLHKLLGNSEKRKELFELLIEEYSTNDMSIEKLLIQTKSIIDKERWRNQEHLIGDIIRTNEALTADNSEVKERLATLYDHRHIRNYLEHLSDKEQQKLAEEAENILLTTLIGEEEAL
ncbi:DNA repair exonuclease [Salipaludibacillus neizhouensis]|uniref:DNA repair exonuclease n=1 Tax=Salipaludibacillus neizhouensis TaxID=885475 RepID=A0A3A9KL28_9BACI|nr:DNA repair exonuclease [Salipaludibacillus neizhouensis]RKL68525.1 DNA repair exonuclease [Salipaludibacillus neizhouensis]